MKSYRFAGINRGGGSVVGRTTTPPAEFVEAKFDARWQSLDVEDEDGELVGSITRHPDTGRRIWWAATE